MWSDIKLFSGYRNDLELTRASFTKDGWFKTGDVGINASGQLALTGRHNATIIVNARKISLECDQAPARRMEGIRGSLVAAAPVRLRGSVTDELALFFVARSEAAVDDLCRSLVREIAEHSGITVKHLVPLPSMIFLLTPTGKVKRDVLVELYQAGRLAPHELSRVAGESAAGPPDEARSWLTDLWRKVLKLKIPHRTDRDFFELGGDLPRGRRLIFAIEEKFSCELPLDAFFERPTIANIENIDRAARQATHLFGYAPSEGSDRLLHKLQSFSGSWQGGTTFHG